MTIKCDAIVEKGLLRPLATLPLQEAERVQLTIEVPGEAQPNDGVLAALLKAGLRRLDREEAERLSGNSLDTKARPALRIPIKIDGEPISTTVLRERNESW